ncbi:hypothetical protein NM688_g9187 [Phlebia brevispora]|uniref:Uncharacterized protein n=1 Tax=Phlebia brevispora TaxID=194682 RepID=A0ACC1RIL8_9APHY|nr:hypothetical protein NM688_g9187 [Phlebia brevispora]
MPTCGPCSRARKPINCTYAAVPAHSQGPKTALLQKGAACLACRRKKKKCDAKRPACNTCKVAGKEYECEYDDELRQSVTAALLWRTQELEQRLAMYESQRPPQLPPAISPPSVPFSPTIDSPMQLFDFSGVSGMLPGASFCLVDPANQLLTLSPGPAGPSTLPMIHPTASAPVPFPALSPFEVSGDVHPHEALVRMLLPNPPLHFSDGAVLPLQNTFELRSMFLAHNVQIGIYLRESKWKAVKEGDFSGEIVHPTMVHLAQLIGGALWRMTHKEGAVIVSEELELRNALSALTNPPEPATQVSINCLLAWYFLFKRQLEDGRAYLVKAYQIVADFGLQLSPTAADAMTPMSEPDEDTKELITALSQLLYLDKAGIIVLSMPSVLNDEYDRQVKALPLMQPWMAKHCVVTMRARSVYFLQQALRLSRIRTETASKSMIHTSDYTALSPDWYTQYWETLEEVSQHVGILVPQMLKSTLCSDPRHGVSLKVCMMIAMAAQLELYRLPATYHAESRQKVLDVVLEIVGLSKGFRDEDFALLDPILGSCWTVVATALSQERQSFMEISEMEPAAQWSEAFSIMIQCASKLGTRLPYMGKQQSILILSPR